MLNSNKLLFISDIHLNKYNNRLLDNFLSFLDFVKKNYNQYKLIILGDFVDFWLENNFYDLSKEYPFFNKLKNKIVENNLDVYLIKGNRDFLAGKKFEKLTNIKVLGENFSLKINNKNIFLTHGDVFCTKDKSYQIWRFLSHSNILKIITSLFPEFLTLFIIRNLRKWSYVKQIREKTQIMNIITEEVQKKIIKNNLQIIICGHNHKMRMYNFKKNNAQLYVMHKWTEWGSYFLEINKEKIYLHTFAKNY